MIGDWIISWLSTCAVAAGQFISNAARRCAVCAASACMLSTTCCCDWHPNAASDASKTMADEFDDIVVLRG
jgi:hypothetical protein